MTGDRLDISAVEVRRGRRLILQVDALRIEPGSFTAVVGTNGAGKTTLLNVCCGLIRPSRGTVRLGESELTRLSAWKKANLRRRIGYVPQSAAYNREIPYTLGEVVLMGRTGVRGLFRPLTRADHELADEWIERLGLWARRSQTFGSLSGGEQQKTLIARAMTQQPSLLILDEPCANLDFNWKHQISDIIERLYIETKMTVLMVSHETSVLPPQCSRVVLLNSGRILADGRPNEVLASEQLCRVYNRSVEVTEIHGRLYATGTARRDKD